MNNYLKGLLVVILTLLVSGMSMQPNEKRPLNIVYLEYKIPFQREGTDGSNGQMMTFDEYDRVQIRINGVMYDQGLPLIREKHNADTVMYTTLYSYEQYLDIDMSLKDKEGRESKIVNYGIFDFTVPATPVTLCNI